MIYRGNMSVECVDVLGDDESVVRAMLVSTNKISDGSGVRGRIKFLMKNRHGTPFEHTLLTLKVSVPIFVAREWMRHRTLSYNEVSARYVEMSDTFYLPSSNRDIVQEGKPGAYNLVEGSKHQHVVVREEHAKAYQTAWEAYQNMLEAGVAREVARSVLPVGLFTQFYASGNVRAWLHFISLRTNDDRNMFKSFPQQEIEEAARQVEFEIEKYFPATMWAFNQCGRVSP